MITAKAMKLAVIPRLAAPGAYHAFGGGGIGFLYFS